MQHQQREAATCFPSTPFSIVVVVAVEKRESESFKRGFETMNEQRNCILLNLKLE